MKFKVEYSPEALDDLRGLYAYIAFRLKERKTAADLVARIRKEARALNELPDRYAPVDWEPWASMSMRHFAVDNFLVFYLVDRESRSVRIVRILYGGQDTENVIQRYI